MIGANVKLKSATAAADASAQPNSSPAAAEQLKLDAGPRDFSLFSRCGDQSDWKGQIHAVLAMRNF